MGIMLGNLTITEMESRTGISFPKELKEYMSTRHQAQAADIKQGAWHCFDIPFTLVCGDIETATTIYSHLKEFSSAFKEPMQISIA